MQLLGLTCAVDRTGMHLAVVPPAGSQGAAALLQRGLALQHAFTQVLVVQVVVALLSLHYGLYKINRGVDSNLTFATLYPFILLVFDSVSLEN